MHCSTKFSPFYMLYQREPILPVDVEFSENFTNEMFNVDWDLDEKAFTNTVNTMLHLRGIHLL